MRSKDVIARLVGARIKSLRKARGLTQYQLALMLGQNGAFRAIVSRTETGVHPPSLSSLSKYAAALGVRVSDIVSVLDVLPDAFWCRLVTGPQKPLTKGARVLEERPKKGDGNPSWGPV